MLWSGVVAPPSVPDMPTVTDEDRLFAERLANVLRELRRISGWTQEEAAEAIGTSVSSLSRWERGRFAPKGYDLGRVFRAYERYGAQQEWFFDPPEVVVTNPVRDRLAELAREAATLEREDRELEAVRRQAAARKRVAQRDRRPA